MWLFFYWDKKKFWWNVGKNVELCFDIFSGGGLYDK